MFIYFVTFLPMVDIFLVSELCGANPFFLFMVIRGGSFSFQYVGSLYLYDILRTATCLIIKSGVVNQIIRQLFLKFIKVSSLFRKYFISIYSFTSLHSTKKENTRMGHQVVPCALSKPIWDLLTTSWLKELLLSNYHLYR